MSAPAAEIETRMLIGIDEACDVADVDAATLILAADYGLLPSFCVEKVVAGAKRPSRQYDYFFSADDVEAWSKGGRRVVDDQGHVDLILEMWGSGEGIMVSDGYRSQMLSVPFTQVRALAEALLSINEE